MLVLSYLQPEAHHSWKTFFHPASVPSSQARTITIHTHGPRTSQLDLLTLQRSFVSKLMHGLSLHAFLGGWSESLSLLGGSYKKNDISSPLFKMMGNKFKGEITVAWGPQHYLGESLTGETHSYSQKSKLFSIKLLIKSKAPTRHISAFSSESHFPKASSIAKAPNDIDFTEHSCQFSKAYIGICISWSLEESSYWLWWVLERGCFLVRLKRICESEIRKSKVVKENSTLKLLDLKVLCKREV